MSTSTATAARPQHAKTSCSRCGYFGRMDGRTCERCRREDDDRSGVTASLRAILTGSPVMECSSGTTALAPSSTESAEREPSAAVAAIDASTATSDTLEHAMSTTVALSEHVATPESVSPVAFPKSVQTGKPRKSRKSAPVVAPADETPAPTDEPTPVVAPAPTDEPTIAETPAPADEPTPAAGEPSSVADSAVEPSSVSDGEPTPADEPTAEPTPVVAPSSVSDGADEGEHFALATRAPCLVLSGKWASHSGIIDCLFTERKTGRLLAGVRLDDPTKTICVRQDVIRATGPAAETTKNGRAAAGTPREPRTSTARAPRTIGLIEMIGALGALSVDQLEALKLEVEAAIAAPRVATAADGEPTPAAEPTAPADETPADETPAAGEPAEDAAGA